MLTWTLGNFEIREFKMIWWGERLEWKKCVKRKVRGSVWFNIFLKQYGNVFLTRHSMAVSRNVEMFVEFPRKIGTNVTGLVMTTAMQCTAAMTTSSCWLKTALFVLCLVDQCYGNLNLYLSQWEVRRLLGKSFGTWDVLNISCMMSGSC